MMERPLDAGAIALAKSLLEAVEKQVLYEDKVLILARALENVRFISSWRKGDVQVHSISSVTDEMLEELAKEDDLAVVRDKLLMIAGNVGFSPAIGGDKDDAWFECGTLHRTIMLNQWRDTERYRQASRGS